MKKILIFSFVLAVAAASIPSFATEVVASPSPSASVLASAEIVQPVAAQGASIIDKVVGAVKWVMANYEQVLLGLAGFLLALVSSLTALAGVFTLIPGAQPEAFLYGLAAKIEKIGDWIEGFSRKKKPPQE